MTASARYRAVIASRDGDLRPAVLDTETADLAYFVRVESAKEAVRELNAPVPGRGLTRLSYTWRPAASGVVVGHVHGQPAPAPTPDEAPFEFRFTDWACDVLDVDHVPAADGGPAANEPIGRVSTAHTDGAEYGRRDAPAIAGAVLAAVGLDPRLHGLPRPASVLTSTIDVHFP